MRSSTLGAQFVGGLTGVLLMIPLLGRPFTQAPVHFAVTGPGPQGVAAAFVGELVIAVITMAVVLNLGSRPRLEPWTPHAAIWLYVATPVAGMLLAAQLFLWVGGVTSRARTGLCAKLYHDVTVFCAHARPEDNPPRCIFCRDRVGSPSDMRRGRKPRGRSQRKLTPPAYD